MKASGSRVIATSPSTTRLTRTIRVVTGRLMAISGRVMARLQSWAYCRSIRDGTSR